MPDHPLLTIQELRVGFDTESGPVVAVDGIDLSVTAGRTLGLVGESGCGKSVTAFSIMRLLPHPHGTILGGHVIFDGRDLATLPLPDMARIRGNEISMIFQEPMTALNPVHPIGRQLAEAVELHHSLPPPRCDAAVSTCWNASASRRPKSASRNTRTNSPAACASAS